MKYLKAAISYFIKNWLIATPLFVCLAIPALFTSTANTLTSLTKVWSSLINPAQLTDLRQIFSLLAVIVPFAIGGGILSFVFQFVSMPATYGLVNEGLETGRSDLNQIGNAISTNFVKYVLYFAGTLLVWLAFGIISVVVTLIFALAHLSVLIILFALILGIGAIILSVLLSLWFSAMVADNLDVFEAAKRSVEIVKSCFWTLVGISLLVPIAGSIISAILGFLNYIPLIGPLVLSVIPAATTFVMVVFYLLVYRDKTGKYNSVPIA